MKYPIQPPTHSSPLKKRSAMTLVEIMISMTIGVTMIGLTVGTMTELYKNFAAAEAYRNVHKEARRSLAFLTRDIRAATNLVAFSPTSGNSANDITFSVLNSMGAVDTVNYKLVANNLQRTATSGGVTTTTNLLTENVTTVSFERWTNPGAQATNGTYASQLSKTYEIRVSLQITNNFTFFRTASDLLQARVLMRNKF